MGVQVHAFPDEPLEPKDQPNDSSPKLRGRIHVDPEAYAAVMADLLDEKARCTLVAGDPAKISNPFSIRDPHTCTQCGRVFQDSTRDGARRKDCPFYQESAERRARIKNRGGGWGIGQKHNRQRPPKNAYR